MNFHDESMSKSDNVYLSASRAISKLCAEIELFFPNQPNRTEPKHST